MPESPEGLFHPSNRYRAMQDFGSSGLLGGRGEERLLLKGSTGVSFFFFLRTL